MKSNYKKELIRECIRALSLHVLYVRVLAEVLFSEGLLRRSNCRFKEYHQLRTVLAGLIKSQT